MTENNSFFRTQYLKAMGVQLWVRRHLPPPPTFSPSQHTLPEKPMITEPASPKPAQLSSATESIESSKLSAPPVESSPIEVSETFTTSQSEESLPAESVPISSVEPPAIEIHTTPLDWDALEKQVAQCKTCELHRSRTQTVFGVGNRQTNWLFIGEAPGADEDAQGEPFVGKAGQLLNNMLRAIHLNRENVFIANIIKCRPPGNRDPLPEEMTNCQTFLQHQIQLIKPKLIIAIGRVAAQHLLSTTTPIGKLRGQQFEYGDDKIPLIATYHPAYLLRRPREKRQSWQDLQFIQQKMTQLDTE